MPECISNHVKVPRTMSKVLKYSVSPNTLQKVFQVSPRWTSTGICITAAPIHQSFSCSHLPLLVHKTLRHLNSSSWVRNSSLILFQLPRRFGSADFHFPHFTSHIQLLIPSVRAGPQYNHITDKKQCDTFI